MSAVSSGVNSLTSAVICDFYQTLTRAHPLTERQLMVRSRWYTLFFEVLVCALAFAISGMKGNLVESVNLIIGLVGGPLLGLFLLGIFTRSVKTRGALLGALVGFIVAMGFFLQGQMAKHARDAGNKDAREWVSFLWVTMIGCLITMAVGRLISVLWPERADAR
jgi:sodium-coupled monocarboxylate transporter 8/12